MAKYGKRKIFDWSKSLDFFVALLIGLILSLVVILVWHDYEHQVRKGQQNKVRLTGQLVAEQLDNIINENVKILENLKNRIEITNGAFFQYWTYDAQRILHQNSSLLFIEWIDSSSVIKRVEPLRGNEAVIGLNISKLQYRKADWLKSKHDSLTNITAWLPLTQGGHAFLVDAPVYYDGHFQGTISAGMNFAHNFNMLMAGREMFNLKVFDHNGNLFYENGDESNSMVAQRMAFEETILIHNDKRYRWTIQLKPNQIFFESNLFYKNRFGLILGLILAGIISIAFYFVLKAAREAKRVKEINSKLQVLNAALATEKQKAEEASRVKTEFLSNMSHEIRTPLNAIIGLINIMQTQEMNEEQQSYLAMMEVSSKNLLVLINDILDIDKIESGKVELKNVRFHPYQELEKLLALYESGFHEKGLYLEKKISQQKDYAARGDVVKYGQVITNLLRNAFKFTESGGVRVAYSAVATGGYLSIIITITDTGIGISKDNLELIFDRFQQVESGYKKKYEGSGLGLAITKKIIDAMGGDISVNSVEGKGSVFQVHFQFPMQREAADIQAKGHILKDNFSGYSVLIAEDNPMNVVVLNKLLEDFSITAHIAYNGRQVLDKLKFQDYDLIFMDIHMPEMDGFDATRKLRRKGFKMPIIALSANVTSEAVSESLAAGMNEYLSKPFTRQAIQKILNTYLGNEILHKNQ